MTDRIGLVGLGFIGAAIGGRLLATGDAPVVLDLEPERMAALVALGAAPAASTRELAETCDLVLVCVQTDEQCLDLVTGPDGLLDHLSPGDVVAVLSTVSPHTIDALAASAEVAGVDLLEAPMAGRGATSVADASMVVLVGGDPEVRERVRPSLERFGRVVDTGSLGTGSALKLAHNVMVYVSRVGALEAVELARAAGVRDGLLAELTAETGTLSEQSAVWLDIYESRRAGETTPAMESNMATAADLFGKDLRHAVDLGAELGVEMPVSAAATDLGDQVYLVRDHGPRAR